MSNETLQLSSLFDQSGRGQQDIRRAAQFGKFFVHTHSFTPFVSAATGTISPPVTFKVDAVAQRFVIQRIAVLADNFGDKVLIKISPNGQQIMVEPMYLAHLGRGQFPLNTLPGIFIGKNNVVTALLTDAKLAAGNNNVRIAYYGRKEQETPILPPRRYTKAENWWYPANYTAQDSGVSQGGALAANATRIYQSAIDDDSDFEVQKISLVSDAPVTVQINSDSDDWFDTPLRGELLAGSLIDAPAFPLDLSGWHPFILPAPRIVTGGAYIRVTVTNQVAVAQRCEMQFHGVRLFPKGGI